MRIIKWVFLIGFWPITLPLYIFYFLFLKPKNKAITQNSEVFKESHNQNISRIQFREDMSYLREESRIIRDRLREYSLDTFSRDMKPDTSDYLKVLEYLNEMYNCFKKEALPNIAIFIKENEFYKLRKTGTMLTKEQLKENALHSSTKITQEFIELLNLPFNKEKIKLSDEMLERAELNAICFTFQKYCRKLAKTNKELNPRLLITHDSDKCCIKSLALRNVDLLEIDMAFPLNGCDKEYCSCSLEYADDNVDLLRKKLKIYEEKRDEMRKENDKYYDSLSS